MKWFTKKQEIAQVETKAVSSYSGQVTSIRPNLPEKICLSNDPVRLMSYNRGYVYAANHKISSALASLPYHLYSMVDSAKVGKMVTPHTALTKSVQKAVASSARLRLQDKQELIEVYDHPVLDLLKNPAPGWSQTEWLYTISTYLGLIGNAYLLKVTDSAGQLVGLKPLMSEHIAIRTDSEGEITEYIYQPYGTISGKTFKPSEIVHIKNRVAGSIIVGLGNLEACLQSFAVSQNAQQYVASLLNNGACPSGVFLVKNHIADEAKAKEYADKLVSSFGGSQRGRPMVTFGDVEYKDTTATMVDTQADKFTLEAKKEICSCFSVPLSTLDETDSNKATALASMKQLKVFGVFPKVSLILDQLNAVFAEYFDSGLFIWIDQREALDPDPLEQSQVLSNLKNAGIMSVNEARLTLGLPSLDGDEYNKPIAANASTAIQAQTITQEVAQ
jgi:HK97 family phage portal protein